MKEEHKLPDMRMFITLLGYYEIIKSLGQILDRKKDLKGVEQAFWQKYPPKKDMREDLGISTAKEHFSWFLSEVQNDMDNWKGVPLYDEIKIFLERIEELKQKET